MAPRWPVSCCRCLTDICRSFSGDCVATSLQPPASSLPLRTFLIGLALFPIGIPVATTVQADEIPPTRQVQVTDSAGHVRQGTLSALGSGLVTLAASEQVRLKTKDLVL